MNISYRKVKSVAKDVTVKGENLEKLVLNTMKTISDVVGATLGPGGCPVLIERQETGMPNMITKDGVTVFRSLGFTNATQHAIMEAARDASVKTANEAGDGTTTATVLAESFVRKTNEFLKKNPKVSPQRVVRTIERVYKNVMEPHLNELKFPVDDQVKRAVSLCSSNGDVELTEAVLKCFDITGDEGNVTILEEAGPSAYKVEQVKGYAVGMGFEDSCKRFFPQFINDKSNNRCIMKNVVFILYYGVISEIQTLYPIMGSLGERWEKDRTSPYNVVVCAMGFSESVLASLAANFPNQETLNIFPLVIPKNAVHNSELHFLHDIQAVTSATVFEPLGRPLEHGSFEDVGVPLDYFEALRYRSNIVSGDRSDESLVMARIEELKTQLEAPESIYEKMMLNERIAKLTGGIAKLIVQGSSAGEMREKRDRAEDAVCAIRGAIKHGALPGAGWGLVALSATLTWWADQDQCSAEERAVIEDIIIPSVIKPVERLMENIGLTEEEITTRYTLMLKSYHETWPMNKPTRDAKVWNGVTDQMVMAVDSGIVDSVPAVNEALRNSISIATLLGTLGGCVVFQRDREVERTESADAYQWLANSTQRDD